MIISNQSNVKYKYVLPDHSTVDANKDSNIVDTEVLTYSVTKVKSSNKTFIAEGETAQQTVVITNNSATTLLNPIFKDTMTSGATYVPNSVIVNNTPEPSFDLVAGFPLPNIPAGGFVTVKYTIMANNPLTETPVKNFASLTYSVVDPIRGPVTFTEKPTTSLSKLCLTSCQ